MSERLGALYHWSPVSRRKQILRKGLRPFQRATVSTGDDGFRQPHVCLGTTPSAAWAVSGDMGWTKHIVEWDLWQVRLAETDEVHFMSIWGDQIEEVQVRNRILKSQIWMVGTRTRGE